jgi:lysozyme family protein
MDAEARFQQAVELVLRHEGGFVDDPADSGGATNYGVSLRFLQSLGLDIGDIDCDGDIDEDDIRKLTRERAAEFYREHWWDEYGYSRINDPAVATKVLDLSVNMGASQAHRVLQRALHAVGHRYVDVDGILGPQTLGAVNKSNPESLLAALKAEAAAHYRQLVSRNSKLAKFEQGWLNRAYA